MGSIATEKELVTHGIIAPGTKIKEGPADASNDTVQEHIQKRNELKLDRSREAKARSWMEALLGEHSLKKPSKMLLKMGPVFAKP